LIGIAFWGGYFGVSSGTKLSGEGNNLHFI